jgi:Mce-associated membrane protein
VLIGSEATREPTTEAPADGPVEDEAAGAAAGGARAEPGDGAVDQPAAGAPVPAAGSGGVEDDDPGSPAGGGGVGRAPAAVGGRRPWAVAAVAVLAVAAIVVESILLVSDAGRINRLQGTQTARAGALAAARSYGLQVASYDYRHLSQDFARVEAESTPAFAAKYKQSSAALAGVLNQYHAVAKATVVAAGVESATSSRAVVLAFINQTVTNTSARAPTTEQSRIQLTLARVHGRWLIDDLKLL